LEKKPKPVITADKRRTTHSTHYGSIQLVTRKPNGAPLKMLQCPYVPGMAGNQHTHLQTHSVAMMREPCEIRDARDNPVVNVPKYDRAYKLPPKQSSKAQSKRAREIQMGYSRIGHTNHKLEMSKGMVEPEVRGLYGKERI
jgi:hypothetical protein